MGKANTVVTLSTLPQVQRHGSFPDAVPASAPFPATYSTDFTETPLNSEPKFFADQSGKFEVREIDGRRVMRQVCPQIGIVYRHDTRPLSVLGSDRWTNTNLQLEFLLEEENATGVFVGIHVQNLGNGGQGHGKETTDMKGIFVAINSTSWHVARTVKQLGQTRAGVGMYAVESSGALPDMRIDLGHWYSLKVAAAGSQVAAYLNGKQI